MPKALFLDTNAQFKNMFLKNITVSGCYRLGKSCWRCYLRTSPTPKYFRNEPHSWRHLTWKIVRSSRAWKNRFIMKWRLEEPWIKVSLERKVQQVILLKCIPWKFSSFFASFTPKRDLLHPTITGRFGVKFSGREGLRNPSELLVKWNIVPKRNPAHFIQMPFSKRFRERLERVTSARRRFTFEFLINCLWTQKRRSDGICSRFWMPF